MTEFPSRTALTTALMRAHHTRTAQPPIHADPWGDVLVPGEFKDQLARGALRDTGRADAPLRGTERDALIDAYLPRVPSYASVILRARYAEDALEQALRAGTRQYVQVGAGFDSFAIRRPGLAADAAIFELDHPATQVLKIERMAQPAVPRQEAAHYIAADFSRESIDSALRRSAFAFDQPAFFSWLGVTIYLTREQNMSALRSMAECGAPGSGLVFTYADSAVFDPRMADERFLRMQRNAASLGEPFVSGFEPGEMPGLLRSCGWELVEDVDGVELGDRYAAGRQPALAASRLSRFALACVTVKQ